MVKKIILAIMVVAALITVTGCKNLPVKAKPAAWVFDMMPKDAPENFKQGWMDGCQSGMANMTNSMFRSYYQFTQNAAMMKDPVYYRTWGDTFHFCRHYAYGLIRQGNDRMRLPNNIPTMMEAVGGGHNVLEHGMLNMAGPATWGLLLENWGETKGSGFFNDQSGTMDFSDDAAFNGKGHGFGTGLMWDFRPTHSIVPY